MSCRNTNSTKYLCVCVSDLANVLDRTYLNNSVIIHRVCIPTGDTDSEENKQKNNLKISKSVKKLWTLHIKMIVIDKHKWNSIWVF